MEHMIIRVSVYKAIFCSSRSLDGISRYISVNYGWNGQWSSTLTVNLEQSSQESAFTGEETLNLVDRLLDSKLDKKLSEFQRGLELKELSTDSQIKKLKTEAKASNSF